MRNRCRLISRGRDRLCRIDLGLVFYPWRNGHVVVALDVGGLCLKVLEMEFVCVSSWID